MEWVDPKQVLVKLRQIELNLPTDLDEKVRRLRTNHLKPLREARIAAQFAYGMSDQILRVPVLVSTSEVRDFDFAIRWQIGGNHHFFPVQLKELPPDDLNPSITLDDVYDNLGRYSGSNDLSVVIHVNRKMQFNYQPWTREQQPLIRELWYLGCESADQAKWFLYGSALERNPRKYDFSYPA
jgi:hypothetical protein